MKFFFFFLQKKSFGERRWFFSSRYSKGGILVPFGEAWREGGGISFDVSYDFYVGDRSLSGGRSIYVVKVGAACREGTMSYYFILIVASMD